MLNDTYQPIMEAANSNMAAGPDPSLGSFCDPVARLWCRSFGVSDEAAIARLKTLMNETSQAAIASGEALSSLQGVLDKAAEQVIRSWFSFVLGREIAETGKALALLRLAFLDSNYEGKWSSTFLSPNVCVQELTAELDSVMIEPTPTALPRRMERQAL